MLWKVTKIKNSLEQLTEFLMNCTGGQLLVTSNILSLSQSHCIPCVMFSLSMARNMNCALRLLSPPVPRDFRPKQCKSQLCKLGESLTLVVLHHCYLHGTTGLWNKSCSPARTNKSLVFNTNGFFQKVHRSPFASQGYLSEWKNHQRG